MALCLLNLPFIAVYLETYGCQMNVNDTEIAWSILQKSGFLRTSNLQEVLAPPASLFPGPGLPCLGADS